MKPPIRLDRGLFYGAPGRAHSLRCTSRFSFRFCVSQLIVDRKCRLHIPNDIVDFVIAKH